MIRFSMPCQDAGDRGLPLWARAAILYLFLPLFPFVAGWLKLWISLPLLALMAASAVTTVCLPGPGTLPRLSAKSLRDVILILAGTIVFALVTGFWDGTPQSTDQPKHSLILGDLAERPWPVRYPGEGGGDYLCYGLGHYMVPALVAKIFGSGLAGPAAFAWGALGLFLFFLGLRRAFGRFALPGIVVFLLCSGLGVFWFLIKTGLLHALLPTGIIPPADDGHFLKLGLYTTNLDSSTRMFYQPQHGIAGWLGGLLIHELLVVRKRWAESAAVLAATFFWSPFTTLGLGVIGLAMLVANFRTLVFRPAIHLAAALAVIGMLTAYYTPHLPIVEKGFIWDVAEGGSWVLWYILFVSCFVLLPAAAVFWLDWKHPYLGAVKPVVVGMTLLFLACPLYKMGYYGDLRMQLSGPAFLFIALAMTRGLLLGPARGRLIPFLFLSGVFLAGSLSPLIRSVENITTAPEADYRIASLRRNGFGSIKDLRMPGFDVTVQYLGRSNAPSALWILKQPTKKSNR